MLHQKADGIAAAPAAKALVYLFDRAYREGGGLLVVKWTKAEIVGPAFFQPYETAYYLDDIDPAEYLLYGLLGDHSS
jgi:hypothetical protein